MFFLFNVVLFLSIFSEYYSFTDHSPGKNGQELLLCRKCGTDIADSSYLISILSPGAIKVEEHNLFGRENVTVQTLVNPFGVKFEIITIEKSRCKVLGSPQGADSWFPGYTWRLCACSCGKHLGWVFESSDESNVHKENQSFHGLILNNILSENFTDSLIMLPNIYKM
ncbi:protein cereblon-like [Ostrinia nubilalis]|uniref:protein cereblon-like n=1 Tax=Ostrinia nubilalis TaxID=29057 RepID=UPI0030826C26